MSLSAHAFDVSASLQIPQVKNAQTANQATSKNNQLLPIMREKRKKEAISS
jgi:hypothetical protein